jgi:repressor LexA
MAGRTKGPISKKQQEILDYMKSEILTRGFPPSVREICEAVKLKSTSSVHAHLEALEKNGYIRKDATKPRAIEIIDDDFLNTRIRHMIPELETAASTEYANVPVIGNVAAGQPILAEENIESYFPVPAEFVPNGEPSYILKVRGDSMINAGIHDGDQIFVHSCREARNGQMVVALIDDSATVKTFYKENGYIRLQPENDTMDPIIVDDCQIIGKLFGVFRIYH